MMKKLVIYLEDEAKRLSELTGVPNEIALAYVSAEDKYFDLIGLNVYEDEISIEKEEVKVLDVDEMIEFIVSETGIDKEICEKLDEAELEYYSEIGLI